MFPKDLQLCVRVLKPHMASPRNSPRSRRYTFRRKKADSQQPYAREQSPVVLSPGFPVPVHPSNPSWRRIRLEAVRCVWKGTEAMPYRLWSILKQMLSVKHYQRPQGSRFECARKFMSVPAA